MIGGNTMAVFQVYDAGEKNAQGIREGQWVDVASAKGWLDYSSGDSKYTPYNAKIQQSTHLFLCDFQSFRELSGKWVWDAFSFINGKISSVELDATVDATSENARMVIEGVVYDIMVIDDPMNLHQHLEIYLKHTGGQSV